MHGLMTQEADERLATEAVVPETRCYVEVVAQTCRPLWLTTREAEALLVLCAASPVNAGPGEQDLFVKLGDYFRLHRL